MTLTLYVCALPAASLVELEFGRPPDEAGTWLSLVDTVNGSVIAVPDTCGANAIASVHVPGAGDSTCS